MEITLQRVQDKKAQVERIQATTATDTPVWLTLEAPRNTNAPAIP